MRNLLVLLSVFALIGCKDPGPETPELPVLPHQTLEVECARTGGAISTVAGGLLACLRETKDASKSCTRKTDCEGQCLARSGTCAPSDPLFGCHEVLGLNGERMTLCRD